MIITLEFMEPVCICIHMYTHVHVIIVVCTSQPDIQMNFPCAVDPLIVDRRYTDTPPHILVSVNALCQDDEYTVTVTFGTRSSGRCVYQQSNISMEIMEVPGSVQFDVPEDLVGDGVEYCSRVVLSSVPRVVGMYVCSTWYQVHVILLCCVVVVYVRT